MPAADARLRARILRWYSRHRRDLPWRRTRDPYAIWVSEIMLQQTRVETVIPYYARFLDRFPDVRALAGAREAEVLAAWSGLGYYRRARNLRLAAGFLVRGHAGRMPRDLESLRELPGVGEYTAAAIASVAFEVPAAAVDGNVVRVFARLLALPGRRDSPALRRRVVRRAAGLANGPRPGDWAQALMELGATVCTPREPLCGRCPARDSCRAAREGDPERYPGAARGITPASERRVLLVARRGRRVLLVPDADDGGESWTLPAAKVHARGRDAAGEEENDKEVERAARTLARRVGLPGPPRAVERIRHRTFSHDLTFHVWEWGPAPWAARRPGGFAALPEGRWVPLGGLGGLPVRSPTLKALKRLRG